MNKETRRFIWGNIALFSAAFTVSKILNKMEQGTAHWDDYILLTCGILSGIFGLLLIHDTTK